jgi:hypothetical protein
MNLVIDVAILKKALIHFDEDTDLHCRKIWDYVCQFSFVHICFDHECVIDKAYEDQLSKSVEFRKWYTDTLPRKYADRQPQRFLGTGLSGCSITNPFYKVLLSVAKHADKGKAILDSTDNEVFTEGKSLKIDCLVPEGAIDQICTPILRWLRSNIEDSFDTSELEILCSDLGFKYENLSGDRLSNKILHLIQYFDRVGELNKLLAYCQKKRPQKFKDPLNIYIT